MPAQTAVLIKMNVQLSRQSGIHDTDISCWSCLFAYEICVSQPHPLFKSEPLILFFPSVFTRLPQLKVVFEKGGSLM